MSPKESFTRGYCKSQTFCHWFLNTVMMCLCVRNVFANRRFQRAERKFNLANYRMQLQFTEKCGKVFLALAMVLVLRYVPDYCYLSYRCSHVYDKHHLNCPYLLFIWVMIDYESLEGWASRKVIKTQVITRIESGTAEFSSSSVTLQLVMINASFSRLL